MRCQPQAPGESRKGGAIHQPLNPSREIALFPIGMRFVEQVAHCEGHHGISKKLQALVAGRSRRFVGTRSVAQGGLQESRIPKRIAEASLESSETRKHTFGMIVAHARIHPPPSTLSPRSSSPGSAS